MKKFAVWEWIFRYSKCSYRPDSLAPFGYKLKFSKNVKYTANFFMVNFIDFDYVINPTIVLL